MKTKQTADIERRCKELWPHMQRALAGLSPMSQSAIIADMTALWLAGHVVRGNPEETAQLRKDLLTVYVDLVQDLVPLNAKQLGTEP
jgi:hypothetical protein